MILRHLTLPDGSRCDMRLGDGLIESTGQAGSFEDGEDFQGYLILPAPVEPHAHLDKAFSADQVPNPGGDLLGAVRGWLAHRPTMSEEDIALRAEKALWMYRAHGATMVRTHVDIGSDIDDIGLRALHAIRKLDGIQVVAFGANPLSGVEGARNRALLRAAIDAGADAIGACPALDPDPLGCIEAVLRIAADRVPLDMHVDESLDPDLCTLSLLAEVSAGFARQVVASHCVSLGMMPPDRVREIAGRVAAAGIAVVCLPQTNLYLQGRDHVTSPPRGLTAVRILRDAGVTVAAGGDNLQDPFNLMGRADPLETAALLILAGHDTPENAYAAVSDDARRAMGLPEVSLRPGSPADLLAIRATSPREAIATAHPERVVIRGGRIVARTTLKTDWPTS
ncbi:MAG TPA: amidohydrolase family protein [Candidatus Limnocylindrales bacterium]